MKSEVSEKFIGISFDAWGQIFGGIIGALIGAAIAVVVAWIQRRNEMKKIEREEFEKFKKYANKMYLMHSRLNSLMHAILSHIGNPIIGRTPSTVGGSDMGYFLYLTELIENYKSVNRSFDEIESYYTPNTKLYFLYIGIREEADKFYRAAAVTVNTDNTSFQYKELLNGTYPILTSLWEDFNVSYKDFFKVAEEVDAKLEIETKIKTEDKLISKLVRENQINE